MTYDSVLVVGFGGPYSKEDVMPFLRNVVRGRNVPDERLEKVAKQYYQFGGASPINEQTQEFVDALQSALGDVPVYLGNRNWKPFLADTVAEMREAGHVAPLAIATSAFSSYSGCRQYIEDLAGVTGYLEVDPIRKIPPFWRVFGFIEAVIERVEFGLSILDPAYDDPEYDVPTPELVFTAHSIPLAMAENCDYEEQLRQAASEVADALDLPWTLVFQSRSGPPHVPWLEPDIVDYMTTVDPTAAQIVVPIGFMSDHMEVLWDLDMDARDTAEARGIEMIRCGTVGTHPLLIAGLAREIQKVLDAPPESPVTTIGGRPFPCAKGCCAPS